MHLDIYSQPDKFSPAQFCRDPKFMPSFEAMARTWSFLQADGHVPSATPPFLSENASQAVQTIDAALRSAGGQDRYEKPFGWQLCDAYPASVSSLLLSAAKTVASPAFVVLTGDWYV